MNSLHSTIFLQNYNVYSTLSISEKQNRVYLHSHYIEINKFIYQPIQVHKSHIIQRLTQLLGAIIERDFLSLSINKGFARKSSIPLSKHRSTSL